MSVAFAVDCGPRFYLAPNRRKFFFHVWNLADLLVIATPAIALFTGEHWTALLRVVRLVRLGIIARRVWDSGTRSFRRGQVKWIALATGGIVVLAWLTVWAQERTHSGSAIHTPFDAPWWAVVTMFTVGYGHTYPHTVVGKVAATVLVFAGIALFGWVRDALASLFVESGNHPVTERYLLRSCLICLASLRTSAVCCAFVPGPLDVITLTETTLVAWGGSGPSVTLTL